MQRRAAIPCGGGWRGKPWFRAPWDRVDQPDRVRVLGGFEHFCDWALLDDAASVADVHAIDDLPDDSEVVGDEQIAEPEPLFQLAEQVEHLGLHRHVQCRDRFVTDDEPRLDRKRPGDGHPLALSARQGRWQAPDVSLRKPYQAEQLPDAFWDP